jgi:hypothetical protein
MRSNGYKRATRSAGSFLSAALILSLAAAKTGWAQIEMYSSADTATAASVPSNPTPRTNETISVTVNANVSALQAPNNRLAAYQATLNWNPAVIQFLNATPAPAPWDTPNLNTNETATGKLEWNDFVAGGVSGNFNLLIVNFRVVGTAGSSSVLDLSFVEMTTSTFMSLLNVLKVTDGKVTVRGNSPPVLTAIPNQTMNEGATLNIPLSATDPDGDRIALRASNMPAFASLTDNGDGTGRLRLTPGRDDAGSYPNIKIFATDNGAPPLSDSTQFNLTVLNTLPPLVCAVGIVTPKDNAVTCDDSVKVCVATTISGTVGPTTKTLAVNGFPVPVDCVKIPLVDGANTIIATLTVKDSLSTCVAADTITVFAKLTPLACALTLAAPKDSAVVCTDSVDVKGATSIIGGVPPFETTCEVNGVPATVTGSTFTKRVKLNAGWNTLIAACTVKDSCGKTVVCRDTVRVRLVSDKTAPACAFSHGYQSVTGVFMDDESGIAKIEPLFLYNAKLTVDPFTPGDKKVNFRLDAIDFSTYIGFDIKITDVCGNSHVCDPVMLQLSAERSTHPYVFTFRSVDRYFHVTNRGLSEIRVELNGKRFSLNAERRGGVVQSLGVYAMPREGEMTIDLQPYLRPAGDNEIRIEVAGPVGSGADLLIIDDIHEADRALVLQQPPEAFELSQNYPNPFNPETMIRFSIPAHVAAGTAVQLRIYNILGEVVRKLVDEPMQPGRYTARWNGRNDRGAQVAAGIYIYRLVAGEHRATKRLLLLK